MILQPNPTNPRTISKEAFEQLKAKIQRNPDGLTANKIVHKNGIIIAGNQRWRAIEELKLEHKDDWFKDVSGWTDEQIREYLVTSNISDGTWDWDLLLNEYEPLELNDWGLEVPDWQDDKEVEEDEAPEVDEGGAALSVLGTVYQLGRHRVMCGDSTDDTAIEGLFGEQSFDLYVTDPPYNVNYEGKTKDKLKIQNDKKDDGEFRAFLADAFRTADTFMKSGASYYIMHADLEGFNFRAAVKDALWNVRQCLVWVKQSMVMGRQDYQWQHEPILYGWKEGASHNWYSDRKQTTILNFDRPSRSEEHPTMKPINLLAYMIGNSSKSGDLIFDSFLGSGSTLIACEQTDRTCYGMELDPKYVDVIRKRYAKFTAPDNQLPENWEELTPAISAKEQRNAES